MLTQQAQQLAAGLQRLLERDLRSADDLERATSDSLALRALLDTEYREVAESLSEEQWRWVQQYLDDADIRLKDPSYRSFQNQRLAKVIAALSGGPGGA